MDFLTKSKYLTLNFFEKADGLNLENSQLRKGFGGRLMTVNWRTEFTKFDIYDYVKISKKQRSHEIEKKEKKILNYNFTGVCIGYRKNNKSINSNFVIRNVLDSFLWKSHFLYIHHKYYQLL